MAAVVYRYNRVLCFVAFVCSQTMHCSTALHVHALHAISGQHPSLLSFLAVSGVAEADSIVLVVDGQAGLHPSDEEVLAWLRQHHPTKPVVLAVNKCESVTKGPTQARCNSYMPSHHCHCETQIATVLEVGQWLSVGAAELESIMQEGDDVAQLLAYHVACLPRCLLYYRQLSSGNLGWSHFQCLPSAERALVKCWTS
jgi:hypothetical protein